MTNLEWPYHVVPVFCNINPVVPVVAMWDLVWFDPLIACRICPSFSLNGCHHKRKTKLSLNPLFSVCCFWYPGTTVTIQGYKTLYTYSFWWIILSKWNPTRGIEIDKLTFHSNPELYAIWTCEVHGPHWSYNNSWTQ